MQIGDLVDAYGKNIGIVVEIKEEEGLVFYLVCYPDGTCDWEDGFWIEEIKK